MNITDTSKKMIYIMIVLFFIELVIFLIFFRPMDRFLSIAFGLIIGTLLAIIKQIFLDIALVKSLDMDKDRIKTYVNGQYFIRHLITIVVLVIVAINHPFINLFSAGLGLINMQLSAYIYTIIFKDDK